MLKNKYLIQIDKFLISKKYIQIGKEGFLKK